MPAPYLAAAAPARDPRQDAGSEPGSLGRTRDQSPVPAPSPQAPSRPLRRPPASRAFPPARTAHARRPRARPAPPIARAPSFPPSLPGSGISGIPLWDSVPAGAALRRRGGAGLGEGSAKEEREAGEAKVAVRAGPRPESPPGGGGRGAA